MKLAQDITIQDAFAVANSNINISKPAISNLCNRYGVARLSLFGSAIREDFHESSDVDLLVEFMPLTQPTYFKLMEMEQELTDLIGRNVDLRTPLELSEHIRQRVMDGAEVQYVCG